MFSSTPDYKVLNSLEYHSPQDLDYPFTMSRRQSYAEDAQGNQYLVEKSASAGQYGKVRNAYFPKTTQIAFVVKELFDFDEKAKLAAEKERKHLVKAWGGCGFKVTQTKIRFFMPYLGKPLSQMLTTIKDEKKVIELAIKTAEQIEAWHKQHITHGDLHQNNILVDKDNVALCDAGLSFNFGEQTSGLWAPTSIQIAPEMRKYPLASAAQDAYAMGQLLLRHNGFGRQFNLINSVFTVYAEEIGFALTRWDPAQRITINQALTQLSQLIKLYPFLNACLNNNMSEIKKEANLLVAKKSRQEEIGLFLAIQSQSGEAVALMIEEKLDFHTIYNNETVLMLALRKYDGSSTSMMICNNLLKKLQALGQLDTVLKKSYHLIKKLSPYEQLLYFEKGQHFEIVKNFIAKKETWVLDKKLEELFLAASTGTSDGFITLTYFLKEAPSYLLSEGQLARKLCFEWFQSCIETGNLAALQYLTHRSCPVLFKTFIQSDNKPPAISRAAELGHFEIVTLLEKYHALKPKDFSESLEAGLENIRKKGLAEAWRRKSFSLFKYFKVLPEAKREPKLRKLLGNIIIESFQKHVDQDDTLALKVIKYFLDNIPESILNELNPLSALTFSSKKVRNKILNIFSAHPKFKVHVHNYIFQKAYDNKDYEKIAALLVKYPQAVLDEKFVHDALDKAKIYKSIDELRRLQKCFPEVCSEYLAYTHADCIEYAANQKWFDGIDFFLNEEKNPDISFVYNFMKAGEYKAVNKLILNNPTKITPSVLLPQVLGYIYFGNLDELKEIHKELPDAFRACLLIKNNDQHRIIDILAKEKGSKYSKGLALFSNKKSLKSELNNFSCGSVTLDKSLRVADPTRYRDIVEWLQTISGPQSRKSTYLSM